MTSLTKKQNPKIFVSLQSWRFAESWGFEHLLSTIGSRVMPRKRHLQTAGF